MNHYKIKKGKGKKRLRRLGFTLIEMLIAMAIFMTFTGILIGSYTGIVRAQRDANEYRDMYVQARQVMETLVQELRDGMVDYPMAQNSSGKDEIFLVSKDGTVKSHVSFSDNTVKLQKYRLISGNQPSSKPGDYSSETIDPLNLNSPEKVKVTKFKTYFSPSIDPYDPANVNSDVNQFQPRVTIYAEFEKELSNGRKYTMDLQTTVSSRIYSQVYSTDYIYTNIK